MVEIDNFDAEGVAPHTPFELLAPGWYCMQFVKSELMSTKAGGERLVLEAQMIEQIHPELAGRKFWVSLNLKNSSAKAVDISRAHLSAICRAVGVMSVTDTEALHFLPLAIKIKVRPADGSYGESNEAGGFDSAEARFGGVKPATKPVAKPAAKPAAKPVVANAAPAKLPWAK